MPKAYYTFRCPDCYTGRKTEEALAKHIEKCKTVRCPECRTRFSSYALLIAHVKTTGHKTCDCGRGHHFPHRPGTCGCIREPWDHLFDIPVGKRSIVCPF